MTAEQEKKTIEQVLGGDRDAFALLVQAHQKNVYALALRTLKNEQDALDISQEVFIKAYSALSSFKGQSRLSVWLYRVTHNMCLDHLRKQGKTQTVSCSADEEEDHPLSLPDDTYEPHKAYEKKELRQELEAAIDSLSEEHRQVLTMRELSDMSYAEIAEELGISEGTVKSRLARARKAAAEFLIKQGTILKNTRHNNERRRM